VDESSLTGEIEPREKFSDPLPDLSEHSEIPSHHNIVFMGTLVCSGHASCVVVATGIETEFGKTSQEMKDIESRRTPLQVKMDDLGKYLSIVSMGIIVIICIIGILNHESFLSMFNIGVSLAVAAIPEGLPICVTVTLALGVMRMAKKNAIIKKLPAVEALGCANFICTDKTGTLTENKMTVMRAFCPALEDAVLFQYYDENNKTLDLLQRNDQGKFITPSSSSILSQTVGGSSSSLGNNAGSSTSLRDGRFELRYNGNPIDAQRFLCLANLFDASCLCNNAILSNVATNSVTGQPTEGALLIAANKLGFSDRRNRLKRLRETNFSSETKFMEVVYEEESSSNGRGKEVSYLKGALEVILPQCVTYLGSNGELLLLSSLVLERINSQAEEMAKEGLRVIAIAYGQKQNQMTFCGIVGLMDPLRFGVIDAVHRIQDSGAKVMMITGDAQTTALSIAKLAGIYDPVTSKSLSGQEIEELMKAGEESLASVIGDVAVCYRTSPRHKLFIVRALQSRGYVVAMTGESSPPTMISV
jgi:Ca2+-transporting ATPase